MTNNWCKLSDLDAPSARSGSHSIYHNNVVFFFGGYTRKGGTYFNDITCYNILSKKWATLHTIGESVPLPRTDHTFVKH